MIVALNTAEQKLARFLAQARQRHNSARGLTERKVSDADAVAITLEGVGAEIAFCKLHNVYPDTGTEVCQAFDALLKDGRGVDVKATRYRSGRLIAILRKGDKPCDLYALMVGEFPNYRFAGYADRDKLLSSITDLGHGPVFALTQEELTDVA